MDPLLEGLGVNPTAPLAIAVAINGSGTAPKGAWFEHPSSLLDVLSTSGGHVRKVGAVKAGRLPEGIAFSRPEGKYVYVGNFSDSNLQVLKVDDNTLRRTRQGAEAAGTPTLGARQYAVKASPVRNKRWNYNTRMNLRQFSILAASSSMCASRRRGALKRRGDEGAQR